MSVCASCGVPVHPNKKLCRACGLKERRGDVIETQEEPVEEAGEADSEADAGGVEGEVESVAIADEPAEESEDQLGDS